MTKDEVVEFVRQAGVQAEPGPDKAEPSVRFYGKVDKRASLNFHCRGPQGHLRADFVFTGRHSRDEDIADAMAFIRLFGGKPGRPYDPNFTVFVRLEPAASDAAWLQGVIQAYWASLARLQ